MAKPTHDEIIRDLDRRVAVLETLLERMDRDIRELLNLKSQVAVVVSELAQVKKDLEEASRRRWSLVALLVGAALGAIGTLLTQLLLATFRK